jgi:ribosome maturation protein Sdo1
VQGFLASRAELESVFGALSDQEICKEILEKGEMQISDKERQLQYDRCEA